MAATYRFTPDALTQKYWGVVEFCLPNCEYKIIEMAPDPEDWGWPQEAVCGFLGKKLKQHLGLSSTSVPPILSWIS